MGNAKYNAGARLLHWTIAVLILANLASGLLHDALRGVISVMPVHKAIGITVLVLALARVGWRMTWKAPPYPASTTGTEIVLAHALHALLYGLMIAMPLSGWIMSSAGKYAISWFGLFDWPKLAVTKGSALYDLGHGFHGIGGWILLAAVCGHVAAALRHHFLLKDGILHRML